MKRADVALYEAKTRRPQPGCRQGRLSGNRCRHRQVAGRASPSEIYLIPSDSAALVKKLIDFQVFLRNCPAQGTTTGAGTRMTAAPSERYPMMLRSAASPGSVGSAGRRWHIVASSYRCQLPTGPHFLKPRHEDCANAGVRLDFRRATKNAARRRRRSEFQEIGRSYLILVSLNSTCFLATGSYLRNDSFSVFVRLFLLVT